MTLKMRMIMMMIVTVTGVKDIKGLRTETSDVVEGHHVGTREEREIEVEAEAKIGVEREVGQEKGKEVETGLKVGEDPGTDEGADPEIKSAVGREKDEEVTEIEGEVDLMNEKEGKFLSNQRKQTGHRISRLVV